MKDIQLVTQGGERITVSESALERFTSGIQGELILPINGNYEEARRLWNGMAHPEAWLHYGQPNFGRGGYCKRKP